MSRRRTLLNLETDFPSTGREMIWPFQNAPQYFLLGPGLLQKSVRNGIRPHQVSPTITRGPYTTGNTIPYWNITLAIHVSVTHTSYFRKNPRAFFERWQIYAAILQDYVEKRCTHQSDAAVSWWITVLTRVAVFNPDRGACACITMSSWG